jgi:outer membrane protein OmpA-like peptidoglycan-associated protein
VADYLDACPDMAGTVKGCPDNDKDGVADNEDQCPSEAGTAATKGCPDTDGDGIIDSKDKCPNVPGVLAFEGCPDKDGDGIRDEDDKCPDVAGVKMFNGCPDTDNDSIPDMSDLCPNKKGPASTKGCPDTDLDGVHDGIDKCPTIAGVAANGGCPEIRKETKQLFQKALQGIQFETGKATIKPVSYPILDAIVKVMNDNPGYKLIIGGHTDDVGNDDANMTLSQNRADAVAKYLISKGVNPVRVSATGYGETRPVDTNKTKAGKARNRRVELSVEFIETTVEIK